MKARKALVCIAGVLFLLATVPFVSHSEVPQQINYQGYLTDSGGNPLNATPNMVFDIYDAATDGNFLWGESQAVNVVNGNYSVQIGQNPTGNPFPDSLFEGSRYLELTVNGEALTPRLHLTCSPFAMKSADADTVGGFAAGDFLTDSEPAVISTSDDGYALSVTNSGSGGAAELNGFVNVDHGNLLVQGTGSFDATYEEGILYLGDTGNYIKAVYDYGVRIGAYNADDALVIQQETGNVGIGVTNPSGKLDVDGLITSRGTGLDGGLRLANPTGARDYRVLQKDDGRFTITDETAHQERIIMDENGNVGIGTIPTQRFSVNGTIESKNGGFKFPDGTTQAGAGITTETDPQVGNITSGYVPVWNGSQLVSSSIYHMLVIGEGFRLGIGTATPEGSLHVSAGTIGDAKLILEADTDNNNENDQPSIEFRQDGGTVRANVGFDSISPGGNDLKLWASSSANDVGMRFLTGSTPIQRMRITADGHVHVGSDTKYLSMWSTGSFVDLASEGSSLAINYGGSDTVMNVTGGNVGIGTSNPQYAKLHVTTDSGNAILAANSGTGSYAELGTDNYAIHAVAFGDRTAIYAQSSGYAAVFDGNIRTEVLEITGGSDLSEQFDIRGTKSGILPAPGMVVSIDSDRPGNLAVSQKAYDRKVAGIISGAGGVKPGMLMGQKGSKADGKNPVALTGRVYCLADASNGAIEPGDLLTSSETPGHAMKVTDYGNAQGAILGKAMNSLERGKGMVLVLVTLQ